MKSTKKIQDTPEEITRKEAIKKIGDFGKYAALTALGTYMMLNPQQSQAGSVLDPGAGDGNGDHSGF
jgi:hypothetical protein